MAGGPDRVQSLVPSSGWRIYTIGSSMPRIQPREYRLQVVGHVEKPVTLTLADLRALPRAEQVSDFKCVTGSLSLVGIADSQSVFRELYAVTALCAQATRRVLIGPTVTNPLTRHPAVAASAIASRSGLRPDCEITSMAAPCRRKGV